MQAAQRSRYRYSGKAAAWCACATLAVFAVLPASLGAAPHIGERDNGFSITDERYLQTYEDCWDAFKARCGRNLIDDGMANGEQPTAGRVEASTSRMDSWLHPPAPEPAVTDVGSTSTPQAPVQTSYAPAPTTSGGCPSYMAAEASSPSAVNPTSGAAGCYQILPSTAAANGCSDVGPDCAARICASQGPSAWAASGANPCPYVQP